MADDRANANEGADPSADIKRQNPGGTTTADIAEAGSSGADGNDDDRAQEDLEAEDLEGFVKDEREQ
jgi:hypothetical protein